MAIAYAQIIEQMARKAHKSATGTHAPRIIEFKILLEFEIGTFNMNRYPNPGIPNDVRDDILSIVDKLFAWCEKMNK